MASREEAAFLREFKGKITHCANLLMSGSASQQLVGRLTSLTKQLEDAVAGAVVATHVCDSLLELTAELLLKAKADLSQTVGTEGFRPRRNAAGFQITQEHIATLQRLNFTVKEMALSIGVSEKTIKRRLRTMGLEQRKKYTVISDEDLASKIREISNENKLCGYRTIQAKLTAKGIVLQIKRVMKAVKQVDPGGVAVRSIRLLPIRRRLYRVAGPNALWHVDGFHKLIRWKFVIHGAVDGYSRAVVMMHASNNNRAATVRDLFVEATKKFGIPSRMRCDRGGENVEVAALMENIHGPNRGSAIMGRSVHNQRIERMWVDLWKDVANVYFSLFTSMETNIADEGFGILDLDNDAHIWALHYVFLPRINRDLNLFALQRNSQGLSTEHGRSPNRLFMGPMLRRFHSTRSTAAVDFWAGRTVNLDLTVHFQRGPHVDPEVCPLSPERLHDLQQDVDPLSGPCTAQQGRQLFERVLGYLPV